jgi:hypothetical protein
VADRLDSVLGALRALARRLPAVVLCALATHVAVYHSLWPAGGGHGYFAWYAPLVAALSGFSIVGLPLVLALALVGRLGSGPFRAVGAGVVRSAPESDPVAETVRLASAALVFLVAQESLERSFELHRVTLAGFAPSTWSVLLAVVVAVAGAVAWLGRAVSSLVEGILQVRRSAPLRPARANQLFGAADATRRSHPLAVHGGLRAPPVGG